MNPKNILTIFKREVGAYFNSAIAYIYLIVFVLINNSLFLTRFFLLNRADMRSFFENMPFVLLVFLPVVSMRLWAEDKKSNTFELLMTFPMKPVELVLGKFLASLIFYAVALASSLAVPVMLFLAGRPDAGPVIGGYLGSFLVGAFFLSIGIFISGLTREQIVAFVLTVLSCFLVFFLGTDFFASAIDGWIPGAGTFIMRTLGAGSHLVSFIRGVIDIKDIFYFVVGSGIFLFLNSLFFEGRLRPKSQMVFSSAVAVCLACMIVFNWIIKDIPWGRFDITEGQVYTVAQSSRKILSQLKAPVQVKVYLTPPEKMPTAMKTLEQDVAGKLEELRISANGRFEYKIIHTEASRLMEQKKAASEATGETPLERSLQDKGILPFQVESIDKDELGVKLVYAAITIDYKDKNQEILPRILPATVPDLEYLILSRVVKMTFDKKPRIALFAPLKSAEITPEMSQILASLGRPAPQYQDHFKTLTPLISNNGYEFHRLGLTESDGIQSDLSALLVFAPDALNDRQRYEINKYLYQGGTVVVAAQGFEYAFQLKPPNGFDLEPQKQPLDINKLIGAWGVKVSEDMLMDENCDIVNVSVGQQAGPFALSMPIKMPNQIIVRPETMNRKLPLMSRQPSFMYLWGSALDLDQEVLKVQELKSTILFTSSNRSWKVPHEGGMLKTESARFPKAGSPGKFPLGVVVEGLFKDAFAGQEIPAWPPQEGEATPASPVAQAKTKEPAKPASEPAAPVAKAGKLIVLGCSKIFTDELIVNGPILGLFANMVDGLVLGDDVVQIRAKTQTNRDLKKLSDAQKLGLRFMTIVLVPALWVIFAFLRLFLRRKEKQFYLVART